MSFSVISFSAVCMLTKPKFNHLFFLSFSLSRKQKRSFSLSYLVGSMTQNAEIHHKLQRPSRTSTLFIHPLDDLCVLVMIRH